MSRIKSKQQLLEEINLEQKKLNEMLEQIPTKKMEERKVVDGMSVKDILAHRTEWGKMFCTWYETAKKGGTPDVPSKKYKWNQLKELNTEIFEANKNKPAADILKDFKKSQQKVHKLIENMTEQELLEKKFYDFTGTSTLAIYACSASASHYRSARRHIQKWWKQVNS